MDASEYDFVDSSTSNQAQQNLFLFNSKANVVRATGVSQRLCMPLTSAAFTEEVASVYRHEKSKGIANPILVGAIPFDLNQPAQLIAPEWYERANLLNYGLSPFADSTVIHEAKERRFLPNQDEFIAMTTRAIEQFSDGDLKKVVLSKILELTLDRCVDLPRLLANIMSQNPGSYHFQVPVFDGALIGASPELLIRKKGERIMSNPLAGSAKRSADINDDKCAAMSLQGSNKDHYEHSLVVQAIQSSLMPFVEKIHVPLQPSLISTPTMWHLSTEIEATLKTSDTCIFELIKELHPTPAMCGTPTRHAKESILDLEPHQRGFFSGLVGWCDSEGNGEWAIAIRCAEVSGNKVRLFAGAGVVPDSNPESEWLETTAKMQTMVNAFGIQGGIA